MSKVNIGRIAPVMQGEWSKNTLYQLYDIVFYKGASYISNIENNINQNPLDKINVSWRLVAERGGDGINLTITDKTYDDF